MKFMFMKEHRQEFNIEKMAKILGVSRQGYYQFLKTGISQYQLENQRLLQKIKAIHKDSRRTYGSPRVHKALKEVGEQCSRKRVARLMRAEKIQPKMRKKWVKTTKKKDKDLTAENHLNQVFTIDRENKVWVSDITYIHTLEGWLYLAVTLDLFSRKVVGMSMGDSLETNLVINALKQAIHQRDIKDGLLHHSDRGSQYTSREFKELADRYNIRLSMSGKGHCYDNAVAESFFHTLKTEHVKHCSFRTRDEAKSSIFEYIEVFYNRRRLHSYLRYKSPEHYEKHRDVGVA